MRSGVSLTVADFLQLWPTLQRVTLAESERTCGSGSGCGVAVGSGVGTTVGTTTGGVGVGVGVLRRLRDGRAAVGA